MTAQDQAIRQNILDSVEQNRDEIFRIGQDLYDRPETGFKEIHAAEVVSNAWKSLGLDVVSCGDIPGLRTVIDTGREGPAVAILGEMDSVICFDHPDCDKTTGAVHACGHHTQIASMIGAAAAVLQSGMLEHLCGKIYLIAVPAEEFIEVEYRTELRNKGVIRYLGGKPELLSRGFFDGVDMCMMVHSFDSGDKKAMIDPGNNGCLVKKIRYIGKAAHAGGRPHEGINALYAANLGLAAINSIRETFLERDYIRIHPIITKGGEIVNVIPSDVRLETFVRGKTMESILSANRKTNRALAGGAIAMGAKVEIEDVPGYFPFQNDVSLLELSRTLLTDLAGEDMILELPHGTGSTDLGDLSTLMPVVQPYIGGATGGLHSALYSVTDPDLAYLLGGKFLAYMVYELLKNGADKARSVIKNYKPYFTSKEEYFRYADALFSKKIYPEQDLF